MISRTKANSPRPLQPRSMAFTLLCCSLLAACQAKDIKSEPPIAPLRPVKTQSVNNDAAALQRVLASTVVSADSQNLSFRIAGSITSLPVDVGDRLSANALVATLDRQPYTLSEKEARAQLAQAEANFRNAESQYQRTRELYSTEAASLSELENAKANASSARAKRSVAQEGLNSAKLNLGYTQLHNPSDNCQVVSVPVALNQNVSAGQTIATTACGDQLRLRTVVPESLINHIHMGMPVTAELQSGTAKLAGKVVEIAVSNNNSSGYAIEVELDSPPSAVKVGMAASITVSLGASNERMIVPLVAVMSDGDEKFVYLTEAEEEHYVIHRQVVRTGELDNQGIEILEGLQLGQNVVVAGMSRINEGMKVTLYAGVDK